jgi:hypothetical protein
MVLLALDKRNVTPVHFLERCREEATSQMLIERPRMTITGISPQGYMCIDGDVYCEKPLAHSAYFLHNTIFSVRFFLILS